MLSFTKNKAFFGAWKKIVTHHFDTCKVFCQSYLRWSMCVPTFMIQLWSLFFFPSPFSPCSVHTFRPKFQITKLVEIVLQIHFVPPSFLAPRSWGELPEQHLPHFLSPSHSCSLPPDSLIVHTLRLKVNSWFIQYSGGTGLCRTVGSVGSVTSTSFTFCCHNLLYFLLFLLQFC